MMGVTGLELEVLRMAAGDLPSRRDHRGGPYYAACEGLIARGLLTSRQTDVPCDCGCGTPLREITAPSTGELIMRVMLGKGVTP